MAFANINLYRQNNGVIAITRCANRTAGRWCCVFLILFGILGKISGVFLASALSVAFSLPLHNNEHGPMITVPNPVLGGVTTFLFASVVISGIRVLSYISFTRRDRFVLAAAFSFGVGDLLVPGIFTHLFERVKNPNKGLEGLFDSITIVLSTPCESCYFYRVSCLLTTRSLGFGHRSRHTQSAVTTRSN
jgi:hypothetical protein